MKYTYLLFALPAVIVLSCTKSEGTKDLNAADSTANSAVTIVTSDSVNLSQTMTPGTFRYVAYDGTNTNVTFESSTSGNTITLKSQQLTLSVPQVDSKENMAIFKDQDILIRAFGDSITIDQGNNVFELKKARGQD